MDGNTLCRKCQYAFGYGGTDRVSGYDENCDCRDASGDRYDECSDVGYSGNYGGDGSEPSCLLDCEQFGLPSGCGFFMLRIPAEE